MNTNKQKEMIDWSLIKMPEIIIDCDNIVITKSEDSKFDNTFSNTEPGKFNFLSCRSNLDDTDSGIHGSNYILVTGLHVSTHSSRRSFREMKKKPRFLEKRSYSTNNLSDSILRTRDDFDIVNHSFCRNCSVKTHSRKGRERMALVDKKIEIEKEPEVPMKISKNTNFQQSVCRISILLVCMKVLLGSTMTGLGLYLKSISVSITLKDCSYWASVPLLLSGVIDIYICKIREAQKRRKKWNYEIIFICAIISLICSIICLLSSIFSGIHGNWISGHGDLCYSEDNSNELEVLSACCYNTINKSSCICREAMKAPNSIPIISKTYTDLTCRYVFSAVKDYLILQCALMAIGSGVCLWWLQILFQRIINQCSFQRSMPLEEDNVRQSPVVPLNLKCSIRNEKFNISKNLKKDNNTDKLICQDNNKYSYTTQIIK